MRRRLFTILSALSLVLCVASGVAWGRSYWWADSLLLKAPRHRYMLATVHGEMRAWYVSGQWPSWGATLHTTLASDWPTQPSSPSYYHFGGFGLARPEERMWHAILPFWFLVGVFGLIAAWGFRRRNGLWTAGLCLVCGYDLRASGERCPECGTPMPSSAGSCSRSCDA